MSDIEDEIMTIYTYMFSCYEYSKAITRRAREQKAGMSKRLTTKNIQKYTNIPRYSQQTKGNRLRAFPQIFT